MTTNDKSSTTRRRFLTSTAVASVIPLAGCTSLLNKNDNGKQTYEDLPEPTYKDIEDVPAQKKNNTTTEENDLPPLKKDKNIFLSTYKEDRKELKEPINLTESAIDNFKNRKFKLAESNLSYASSELQEVRIIMKKQDMIKLAESLNSRTKTKLNFKQLVLDINKTISAMEETIKLLHKANEERKAGNAKKYYDLLTEAKMKIEEPKFLLPESVDTLYNKYDI